MSSTTVLAIDQSLTHSAAVTLAFPVDGGPAAIERIHAFKPCTTGIYRLMDFEAWVEGLVEEVAPHVLAREAHTQAQRGAANALPALGALLDRIAAKHAFLRASSYAMVPPGTWKKFCLGKGNLRKDTAYMMHLNRFFERSGWLAEPDEVLDDNVGDAICIGITGWAACRARYDDASDGSDLPGRGDFAHLAGKIERIFDYGREAKP